MSRHFGDHEQTRVENTRVGHNINKPNNIYINIGLSALPGMTQVSPSPSPGKLPE